MQSVKITINDSTCITVSVNDIKNTVDEPTSSTPKCLQEIVFDKTTPEICSTDIQSSTLTPTADSHQTLLDDTGCTGTIRLSVIMELKKAQAVSSDAFFKVLEKYDMTDAEIMSLLLFSDGKFPYMFLNTKVLMHIFRKYKAYIKRDHPEWAEVRYGGFKRLMYSAQFSELYKLTALYGPLLDVVKSGKNDVICFAASKGHTKLLAHLIYTYDFTSKDVVGDNDCAMVQAATNGCTDILKTLFAHFSLTMEDLRVNDDLALKMAIRNGHVDTVKFLLDRFDALWNTGNPQLDSAALFSLAAKKRQDGVLSYLLDRFNNRAKAGAPTTSSDWI